MTKQLASVHCGQTGTQAADVSSDRLVELQLALLFQHHERGGSEYSADWTTATKRVRRHRRLCFEIRDSKRLAKDHAIVFHQRDGHSGRAGTLHLLKRC